VDLYTDITDLYFTPYQTIPLGVKKGEVGGWRRYEVVGSWGISAKVKKRGRMRMVGRWRKKMDT
jgi:hypothetical protein